MFEAYKIGVRIGVVDATGGGILKIAQQFAKAQREASAFLTTLRKVNEELRRSTAGWASGAANDFNRARRAAENYTSAAGRAARSAGGAPGTGMVAMAAFAGGYGGGGGVRMPAALPSSGRLALGYGGGSAGIPGLPGATANGGSFGGLRAAGFVLGRGGGGGFGGGGGGGAGSGAGGWQGGLGRVFGGMILEHAGHAELGMLSKPLEEAAAYQSAVARFSLFGLGDKLNAQAIQFANSMHIIGTSMTDAVNFMAEAQGVFRESGLSGSKALAGAKLAAPLLAKIHFATEGLDPATRAKMDTQALDMLRFVEMRGGLSSPARFKSIAEEGWKAIRSSGGNVNWSQLRQFMATGSVAVQGMTDQAIFGEMEPIIGEMKGGGAGHGLMTAYSRINGLQRLIPRIMQREMMRLHLWDRSKLVFNSQGGIKDFKGDPLRDANLFSSSPYQYYKSVVLPAYQKAGITKEQDIFRENAILFGNTGGKLFSIMYRQMHNIDLSVKAQQKTLGIDASVNVAKGTFAGQMVNYHKQMETLQTQLGLVILPTLIRALKWLNPHLKAAADWIGSHSALTKGLVIVFAALGGLAMISGGIVAIGGAFTMIAGAITAGGGLAAGLVAFGSALLPLAQLGVVAVLAYKFGGALNSLIEKFPAVDNAIGSLGAHILSAFGVKSAEDAIKYHDGMTPEARKTLEMMKRHHMAWEQQQHQVAHVTHVHLDGKKIATVVTKHQADAAGRPQSGRSGYDPTAAAPPIGLNYAH